MAVLETLSITGLIFGGCCSNVYALEAILRREPNSGLLVTFFQFFFAALSTYLVRFDPARPLGIGRPAVPLQRWIVVAAMFYAVNMLNNWAFAFSISVPVHIILRSFGSVTTMGAGWLKGKRYTTIQVGSVAILTVGVIVSAWADALQKGKVAKGSGPDVYDSSFAQGLVILLVAQLLSAYMGIYVQDTYAMYGKHWVENLFFEHLLSLPLFLPLSSILRDQFQALSKSPPLMIEPRVTDLFPAAMMHRLQRLPSSLFYLLVNALTQLVCVSGVNLLGTRSSAVTVTVVLNVRKLVSFFFSIWLFGNRLNGLMILGATLVFGAGALYGWETSIGIKLRAQAYHGTANGATKLEGKKQI